MDGTDGRHNSSNAFQPGGWAEVFISLWTICTAILYTPSTIETGRGRICMQCHLIHPSRLGRLAPSLAACHSSLCWIPSKAKPPIDVPPSLRLQNSIFDDNQHHVRSLSLLLFLSICMHVLRNNGFILRRHNTRDSSWRAYQATSSL
jgi:hypothetical protein